MAYRSMRYFLFKKLLKARIHVDLHQTEPVPPCPGAGYVREPGGTPPEVACGGSSQMHQPGFHQPNRACASQITHACALCTCPLDAGSTRIRVLEGFRLLPPPRRLESDGMIALTDAPGPWGRHGTRTVRAPGARPTHRLPAGNPDRGMAVSLWSLPPDDAPLPLWAERVLGVPIERALGGSAAVPGLPLPTSIMPCRTHKVSVVSSTTRPEVVGGDRAPIDALFPRGARAGSPLRLHSRQHGTIGGRGRGGRHLGAQGGRLVLTGCGAMPLGARPCRLALFALARVRGIGRADAPRCWGQIRRATPAHGLVVWPRGALLQPPLPPRLEGREFPEPDGCGRIIDGPQHLAAGRADWLGQGRAGGPLRREARVRKARAIAVAPPRRAPGWPPGRRGGGPPGEGMAQCLPDARQPMEGLASGQDMGRVGALAALRCEEPLLAQPRQHRLDQQECGLACEQALAELAQHRGSEARLGPRQGQGVLPVKTRPDRIRRLGVREPCGTWQNANERELGWGVRRASGMRKERSTGRGRLEGTARVSHPHRGMPRGERGAGHLYGLLRHAVTGRSGQRQWQPPVVGWDATGYGTTHGLHHTADARPWNRVAPWMAASQGLPATFCQETHSP